MGTQSGVCDARCLNYTETWLGGSFSSSKGKGPKIVGDSSPHEMNKNIIGLDKPASWRKAREKPGGCALFKRGIDIYFFICASKYVFFFRGGFTTRYLRALRLPVGVRFPIDGSFSGRLCDYFSSYFVHRGFNVRFIFIFFRWIALARRLCKFNGTSAGNIQRYLTLPYP